MLDRSPVAISAELSPMLWRGRQWAVTEYGIEKLDGSYPIEKERLAEEIDGPGSWPAHMSGKTDTDIEEFVTAWLVALALHGIAAKPADIRKALARRLDYED